METDPLATVRACIVCSNIDGMTPFRQKTSRECLEKIRDYANKRASFGETQFSPLCEMIACLTEQEYFESVYHIGCYSSVVNNLKLRSAEKRFTEASLSLSTVQPPKRGRPSSSKSATCSYGVTGHRQRRSSGDVNIRSCVFQCSQPTIGELHRVETESMGRKFMFIKSNTPDEKIRTALANVNQPLDCAAFDLVYHRDCLRNAERRLKASPRNETRFRQKIRQYIADVDILNSVKYSLASGSIITMNDINEAYTFLLIENDVEPGSSHHKKHLKTLIADNIDDVTFVKSHRLNESEQVISEGLLGMTVSDLVEHQDEECDVKCIAAAASILRKEISETGQWCFSGVESMKEFKSPPMLVSFLRWLLFGKKVDAVKGKRKDSSKKSVTLAAQHIIHNFKTDRQTTYQPARDTGFRKKLETPLSVGLALTIHKKTRSKNLVNILSELQLGSSYNEVVAIEKRIACGVADRMKTTGGFCLPPFVKKGKSVYFAADNIDFLENTADGQNTLHGTILVLNQNQDNSDDNVNVTSNEHMCIPDQIVPLDINTDYKLPPNLELKPVTVDNFKFGAYDSVVRKYETYNKAWFAAFFAVRHKMPVVEDTHQAVPSNVLIDDSEHDGLHRSGETMKSDIMPTWAATNSLLIQSNQQTHQPKTQSAIVAPLLRKPPTDFSALYTALCLAQGISAFVVGSHHKTIITLDLDLYERALKLQSSSMNTNWVLRVGELHTCFASLHALAKYIEGSGIDSISIESGIYSPSTIRQIFTGKWFKRGVEYHFTNVIACYDLLFDAFLEKENLSTLVLKSKELRDQLHTRQDDVTVSYDDVSQAINKSLQSISHENLGEIGQFLMCYIKQFETLLQLIRATRQGEWELHLGALDEQVKYFFAHDLYKYARFVPVYLAQMQVLRETDGETWESLKGGNFMVTKSGIPFTNLFVDQTMEQLIRELKVAGGITGLTQNEEALDRFFMIAPEVVSIIRVFQDEFCVHNNDSPNKEHYQLSGSMAFRLLKNSSIIKEGITRHCGGNPFLLHDTKLMNISSNMEVQGNAKDDILLRDDKGSSRYREFVQERMVSSAEKTVWDPMKKLKLKTFNTCHKKTCYKIGDKLIKLREDRQLLARFLVVQQSRPGMIQTLSEAIGKYEFSIIPRSLFSSDGLLLLPVDKSDFLHALESQKMEPSTESTDNQTMMDISSTVTSRCRVCIIDAMAVVQSIKKGASIVNCSHFAQAFVQIIRKIISGYDEGRVNFDRYIENSLKAQTRGKRSAGIEPVKFCINNSTNIKLVPLRTLLSHIETKSQLTEYLGKALLQEYMNSTKNLVVVYGTSTYSNKAGIFDSNISEHSHEEADTLIPMHVLDASKTVEGIPEIDVYSPDTDVFLLLLDLVSNFNTFGKLNFITGRGKAKRTIDIRAVSTAVGNEKCKGLLGLHAFTGADWGGKFAGISKNRWIKHFLSLDPHSKEVRAFHQFGKSDFSLECVLSDIEGFVCSVYSGNSKIRSVTKLRWELFQSKNLEAEKLPPTLGALKPHIERAHVITSISKGYKEPHPIIQSLINNGWEKVPDGTIHPIKCMELPAPQAVVELVKCLCRFKCANNCSCIKNNLPCTALCRCTDCGNITDYHASEEDTD